MNKTLLFATFVAPLAAPAALFAATAEKPNIVFIFADDHSYNCIGSLAEDKIYTPNLDKLIERGTLFTHAFNQGAWNGAVSVASRSMLATGVNVWKAHDRVRQENVPTWSKHMREAGYETYITGKWHVDGVKIDGQFDHTEHIRGGMANQSADCYNRKFIKGQPDKWQPYDTSYGGHFKGGKHWAEVVKDDAKSYIEMAKESDKPFFMYLAFNSPHDPRQSPKEYVDMYNADDILVPDNFLAQYPYAAEVGCPKSLRDERLAPFPRTEYSILVNRMEYYAMISHLDTQVGAILDELEKSGKMDNTYIIYTADHGLSIGDHGFLGKQNMYDASMRMPFIVVGPGVEAGARVDDLIYMQDAMATALDWASSDALSSVDFQSLRPQLEGRKRDIVRREAVYGAYLDLQRSIRTDEYQMMIYPAVKVVRLYNIKKDPNAMVDLAGDKKYRKVMKKLFAQFEELQAEMGDELQLADLFDDFIGE